MKIFATLLFALCVTPLAVANTLTLVGTGTNQTSDGVYTYPYNMEYNGGTPFAAMCLSYDDHIDVGETWGVTLQAVTTTVQEESAWLFSDAVLQQALGNYNTVVADNDAAWGLTASDAPVTSASETQLALALADYNSEPTGFYSHFVLYVPTGAPAGYGLPQTFIGMTTGVGAPPSPTPEPTPLLMLGTGLLFLSLGGMKLKTATVRN